MMACVSVTMKRMMQNDVENTFLLYFIIVLKRVGGSLLVLIVVSFGGI